MIIKQYLGYWLYLGGSIKEIEPINFSCYNFCNECNADLIYLSDNFAYFVTTEDIYIKARSRNIHYNWKYSNKEGSVAQKIRRTRVARKLSILKAKQELENYKLENFITNNQNFSTTVYSFGNIEEDLEVINNIEPFISQNT